MIEIIQHYKPELLQLPNREDTRKTLECRKNQVRKQ